MGRSGLTWDKCGALLPSLPNDALWTRSRDFSSAVWPLVLPAIYLMKKNIRKQGALVGHEKVGPPSPTG